MKFWSRGVLKTIWVACRAQDGPRESNLTGYHHETDIVYESCPNGTFFEISNIKNGNYCFYTVGFEPQYAGAVLKTLAN